MSEDNKNNPWFVFGLYGALGTQLALTAVAGLFLGHYLDGKWATDPWLTLLGLLLGASGGLYNLIRVLKWQERRQ